MRQISPGALRATLLRALPLILLGFGWALVIRQSMMMEDAVVRTYQSAQLEVVRNASRAAELHMERALADGRPIALIEQRVLREIVKPIRIGNVGDAFIYSPDYVIFDQSEDFPAEYQGKNIAEIFALQQRHGADHYDALVNGVREGREGVGWYVWSPAKAREQASLWEFITRDAGVEVAAWTPVRVFAGTDEERTWVIGMSAMLTEIMRDSGAYDNIHSSLLAMGGVSLLVGLLFVLLGRAERRVQALQREVQALHIAVDSGKRDRQVAAIVETEYFQTLATRAQELRGRRQAMVEGDA